MRRWCLVLAALVWPVDGAMAQARTDLTLTLASDDLFRGQSQSGGHPIGRAAIGFDLSSGLYGGLAGSMTLPVGYPAALGGLEQYAGYARRLSPRRTLDIGVTHASYHDYIGGKGRRGYAAFHVGLIGPAVAVRMSLSPDYFASRRMALYGEVDATPFRGHAWDVTVHAGLLATAAGSDADRARPYAPGVDWRVGVERRIGRVRVEGALAGAASADRSPRALASISTAL